MASRQCCVALACIVALVPAASAQCPDGTQPKAGRCFGELAVRTIDPQRIAILPFNTTAVSASLAHIGTGFMELISSRFTGDYGPTAVDPGESYVAWTRAGGTRAPLTQQRALEIARTLGAGQAVLGSVVESGNRLIVTASLLKVGDRNARPERVEVEGSASELGTLTVTLAARLQGRAAGIAGAPATEALLAFMEGMAAYRRWGQLVADSHLVRAAQLDTTFTEAAYRATMLRARLGPSLRINAFCPAFRHLWRSQSTLGVEKRALLAAVSDPPKECPPTGGVGGLVRRPLALQRMERTIKSVPNSADAWVMLGDGYYFMGSAIGREDWKARARQAFNSAMRLDPASRAVVSDRLKTLAFMDGDAREFARYEDSAGPEGRYKAALLSGNATRVRAARAAYVEVRLNVDFGLPFWLTGAPIPQHEADTLLLMAEKSAGTDTQRCRVAIKASSVLFHAGRPEQAMAKLSETFSICPPPADTARFRRGRAYLYMMGDSALSEADFERWRSVGAPANGAPADAMFSRVRRGDSTGAGWFLANRPPFAPADRSVDDIIAALPPGPAGGDVLAAYALMGVLEPPGSDGATLRKADSLLRRMPRDVGDDLNYDLAVAFARRGDYAMAAAAARRRVMHIVTWEPFRQVPSLRLEGRWAALAGDTAAAIRAYREYLLYRESPEPSLVPQRDSVIAELAALTRSRRVTSPRPAGSAGKARPR